MKNAAHFFVQTQVKPEVNDDDIKIFTLGAEYGFHQAINALADYKWDKDQVSSCLHSAEWAEWLASKREDILKGQDT